MGKTISVEAVILKTYDVGEADRFCILFTKQLGKLTARARSVRKLTSRMGGSILAMQHVNVQLRESSSGWQVSDVQKLSFYELNYKDIAAFLRAQQGIELLLHTTHDEEPMEDLFTSLLLFLKNCTMSHEHCVLPFTIQLLSLMGTLPETSNIYFCHCSHIQKEFITLAACGKWGKLPTLSAKERHMFSGLCTQLLSGITTRPLRLSN